MPGGEVDATFATSLSDVSDDTGGGASQQAPNTEFPDEASGGADQTSGGGTEQPDPCNNPFTVPIFGPVLFERKTGKPQVEEVPFFLKYTSKICVQVLNGTSDTPGAAQGDRASAAWISVDDVGVAFPSDFSQSSAGTQATLELEGPGEHMLAVKIASAPGSILEIVISAIQIAPDSTPELNILDPDSPYYIYDPLSPYYGWEPPERYDFLGSTPPTVATQQLHNPCTTSDDCDYGEYCVPPTCVQDCAHEDAKMCDWWNNKVCDIDTGQCVLLFSHHWGTRFKWQNIFADLDQDTRVLVGVEQSVALFEHSGFPFLAETDMLWYAPTLLPPGLARYESAIFYSNRPYNPYFIDWCAGWGVFEHALPKQWVAIYPLNFDFRAKYVGDNHFMKMMVGSFLDENVWEAWLYNYQENEWELKAQSPIDGKTIDTNPTKKHGWNWLEVKSLVSSYACVPQPAFMSRNLWIWSSTIGLQQVGPDYGEEIEIDWFCGEYIKGIINEYYEWGMLPYGDLPCSTGRHSNPELWLGAILLLALRTYLRRRRPQANTCTSTQGEAVTAR